MPADAADRDPRAARVSARRPPATPDELLASLPDVHPSMVPAYLAEAAVRVLVEMRDDQRAVLAELRAHHARSPWAGNVPAQRPAQRPAQQQPAPVD